MSTFKLMRMIRDQGWAVEFTRGGHLVCRHPDAAGLVHVAASPSDRRAWQRVLHDMRRELRAGRREGRTP